MEASGVMNERLDPVGTNAFWETSFQQHGSALLAFLASRTGRRDLAEDLLQETFVKVMRTPTPLRDASKVRSYLFSTAHRLLLNQGRRQRPVSFAELGRDDAPQLAEVVDFQATPEELADLGKLAERLRQVLDGMPPAHARAFEAAVLEQKSYAEIAEDEAWTLDQVRMNVYRGRKRAIAELRDLLRIPEESDA